MTEFGRTESWRALGVAISVATALGSGCSARSGSGGGAGVIDVSGDPVAVTKAACLLDIARDASHPLKVSLDNFDKRDPTTLYSTGSTASLSFSADAPGSGGALDGQVFNLYLIYDAAPTEREDQTVIKWYWPTDTSPSTGVALHVDAVPARDSARREDKFTTKLSLVITEAQIFYPAGQTSLAPVTLGAQTIGVECQGQVIESAP